ncbi:GNAT family N-acetyltransferase [Tropicimonas sp. IMCC34043]|uniref:GNAT family N-acetyltransferase n=1 Tax=Tropicimonas sp. IMCC34043 TaxID=2248760 RepID=UPI0013009B0B|nr:GNAT family N-acetyltransferase [Tropicimonas sp. IMCC34043]
MQIRKAEPDDRQHWETLWRENCAHFGATNMNTSVVDALWCRILDAEHTMDAWLAMDGQECVGLAHTILHPHTFTLRPVCYLEDLWVSPAARSQGVATNLISHLSQIGEKEGWRRLYWETASDNAVAKRLYDRLASPRPVAIYEIALNV